MNRYSSMLIGCLKEDSACGFDPIWRCYQQSHLMGWPFRAVLRADLWRYGERLQDLNHREYFHKLRGIFFWTVGQFTNLRIRIFTMKSFEPELMQITKLLKYFWFYWFLFGNFKWFRQYKLNLNMTHYTKVWRVKSFTIKAAKKLF